MSVSLVSPAPKSVRQSSLRKPVSRRSGLTADLRQRQAKADDSAASLLEALDKTTDARRRIHDGFATELPFASSATRLDAIEGIAANQDRAAFDDQLSKCAAIADEYRAAAVVRSDRDSDARKKRLQAVAVKAGLKAGIVAEKEQTVADTARKMAKYSVLCRELPQISANHSVAYFYRDCLTSIVKWHDDSADWRLVVGTAGNTRSFTSDDALTVSACLDAALQAGATRPEQKQLFDDYLRANGILPPKKETAAEELPGVEALAAMVAEFVANNPACIREKLQAALTSAIADTYAKDEIDANGGKIVNDLGAETAPTETTDAKELETAAA